MTSHLARVGPLLGLAVIVGLGSTAIAAKPQVLYRRATIRSAVPPIIIKKRPGEPLGSSGRGTRCDEPIN